jgi:hypothetical protein
MLHRLMIVVALCALPVVDGCKAGTEFAVQTPLGEITGTYNGNAKQAYNQLEDALADCLNYYTEAVLAGNGELAGQWQDVIDEITDAKESLSEERSQVPPGSLGSVS